jgi:hypothetical protein
MSADIMTKELLLQCLNEAQGRVDDKGYPLEVRIRSRITVNDCIIRAEHEGWNIDYAGNGRWKLAKTPGRKKQLRKESGQ